jgi:hypothetical protein
MPNKAEFEVYQKHQARIFSLLLILFLLSLWATKSHAFKAWISAQSTPTQPPVVARIHFSTWKDLQDLSQDLEIWEVNSVNNFVIARLTDQQKISLVKSGHRVEIIPRPFQTPAAPVTPVLPADIQ